MFRGLYCAVSIIGLVGVADALRAQIPIGVISTYAGGGKSKNDGVPATDYKLSNPADVAVDALGNVYIADSKNNQVVKVDRATLFLTVGAGTGTKGYNGDNLLATSATGEITRLESLSTPPATCTLAIITMRESGV